MRLAHVPEKACPCEREGGHRFSDKEHAPVNMNLGNRRRLRKGQKKWRLAPGGEPAAREPGRGTGRGDVTGDA